MSDVYKKAGVDVEKGYEAVERMKKHIKKTHRKEVLGSLGSFAGAFDLSSFSYKEPVLLTGTDGVGTKLKLAFELDKHDTVGIDLVAMCVNDIIAQGGDPLFFLDYIACGENDPARIEAIVSGVAAGCQEANAALIGGETAEMPGMYEADEYDLAGFVVGIVEKEEIITGKTIAEGDTLIGLASSGIHSNGYSLVRQLIEGLDFKETPEGLSRPLGEVVMEPTRIYTKAIKAIKEKVHIKGIAHITGGGFDENIPRMLPEGLGAAVQQGAWDVPKIFPFLQKRGEIDDREMYRVFNMGIGMVIAVSKEDEQTVCDLLQGNNIEAAVIGYVVPGEEVQITS
ncbi:phosphoribosylformylglycinamidine cyclo-ligase [Oceanobacillus neutriphilus]|uniref:Phosphoribosylformylglycinamidine cyclo-ligase n=1 Tax=Oceanobacillus neutriphilus TaxID=531815 RepID=A0ABQ2NQ37_9BACI|nr:phosphoribosylformylglycinamidine cyclo-ligase [Oceanobacillus neutriphilus]GGP08052.1 phosphoribosylformylglycinamidine cyclo-ligase [Oceanobacillus neutriphilus]